MAARHCGIHSAGSEIWSRSDNDSESRGTWTRELQAILESRTAELYSVPYCPRDRGRSWEPAPSMSPFPGTPHGRPVLLRGLLLQLCSLSWQFEKYTFPSGWAAQLSPSRTHRHQKRDLSWDIRVLWRVCTFLLLSRPSLLCGFPCTLQSFLFARRRQWRQQLQGRCGDSSSWGFFWKAASWVILADSEFQVLGEPCPKDSGNFQI